MKQKILRKILGKGLILEQDLAPYLTLKIGGKAKYFFVLEDFSDWLKLREVLRQNIINVFLLAGGSNLVLKGFGEDTLVVLNRYSKLRLIGEERNKIYVKVSSGYPMSRLVKKAVQSGWEGLEYHWGLPGTLGGAVYMNAKWTKPKSSVGDVVYKALLLTKKGEFKEVGKDYFQFAYDYSILQKTGEFVVEVYLEFKKEDPKILYERAMSAYSYRRSTQPVGVFSSGCFFKNISEEQRRKFNLPTTSAGYLIDKAGLKGLQIGEFVVSEKHANFILHKGGGKFSDLQKLVKVIKEKVKQKFGIDLELEVILV